VSGTLGDARLALEVFRGTVALPGDAFARVRQRMERPTPRIALGERLRGVASACIDVSDGLAGDLGHILAASAVGATLDVDALPISPTLRGRPQAEARRFALAGGDDYELCFTSPSECRGDVDAAGAAAGVAVTRIGRIEAAPGLRVVDTDGRPVEGLDLSGFDHFRHGG
jgi:thiamine-monophosphate kinase